MKIGTPFLPGGRGRAGGYGRDRESVLREMLGHRSVAGETLQRLSENRFSAANLWGKLANVCADIPSRAIRYSGTFKMLIGGDLVSAEHKNQRPFYFVNGSKLAFSANELPAVEDRTTAFWRRWILVPFPVDLTGREDRTLIETLRAELPGILNWAIQGVKMLRKDGGFPRDATVGSLMETWKQRSDSIYWFASECITLDPNGWIEKQTLYDAYKEFCDERSLRQERYQTFCERIPTLPNIRRVRVERASRAENGKRPWGFGGLVFSPKAEGLDKPDKSDKGPCLGDYDEFGKDGGAGHVQAVRLVRSFPPAEKTEANEIVGTVDGSRPCDTCGQEARYKVRAGIYLKATCATCLRRYDLSPPKDGGPP